jgi:hypothetical protein
LKAPVVTVRHHTIRSKGCLSNRTTLAMIFKLVEGQPVAKTVSRCEIRRRAETAAKPPNLQPGDQAVTKNDRYALSQYHRRAAEVG